MNRTSSLNLIRNE
jgi:hypothetical protein